MPSGYPYSEEAIRRLFKKLRINPLSPVLNKHHCLEYTGTPNDKGYGRMRIDGPMRYAHRVMCEIGQKRALAEDEVARHECDNPLCCEPTHLTPGSILDNNDDRNKRGKAVGAKPGRRHLTRADAAQIKVRIGMGQSTETILDAFPHASSKQVRDIRKSRTWVGLGISKHTPACDRIVDEFARA